MSQDELPKLDPIELQDYRLDIDRYLKTDYDDISVASQELPALIEWINSLVQLYVEEKWISKQAIKETEAEAYNRIANDPQYEGKRTEAAISREVVLDASVKKVHRRHARVCGWVSRLVNLQLSFQAKLDLVRSSESTRRKIYIDTPTTQDA